MSTEAKSLDILVVDDNLESGRMTCLVLESMGHRARSAAGGEEAIRLAVMQVPDVVLMDVRMPGTDGFEATRRIKTMLPELVVIAMSGFASREDIEIAAEAGCDAYLQKPLAPERLRAALATYAPH